MAECVASAAASPLTRAVANASFALFIGALPLATKPQGCFLSPLSIVYALSLALNGAGPKSATHDELLRAITGPSGAHLGASEADLNSELGRAMALLNNPAAAGAAASCGPGAAAAAGGEGGGAAGGPTSEMVLANSVWTARGMVLKPAYVEAVKALYQ
ncbi:hypothetical protein TSOC_005408, partial [Tetrabaena socialis]